MLNELKCNSIGKQVFIKYLLYVIYSVPVVIVETKIEMGLKEKYFQVCLVGSKMFSKCYPLLLLFLMEVHLSSEILEQTRVSQRKGIEIQVSSRKPPDCSSLSKEGLSLAKTGLSEWTVWKESCIMLFTHRENIHYVVFRHCQQCICLSWQINGCLFSQGHSFS